MTRKVTDVAAKIKFGEQREIWLGNIDAKWDWDFAGDYVEEMWLMLQQIEAGLKESVFSVGNLEAWRDFTYVRDIVHAYVLLIEKEGLAGGIYNVSSGAARKIEEIFRLLIRLSSVSIEVNVDPAKYRPNEVERFAGSNKKIQEAVNWTPTRDFKESLRDTLDSRRSKQKETTKRI